MQRGGCFICQCYLVKLFDFVPHSVSSAQLRQFTFLHLAGMIPSTYRITLLAEVSRLKNLACNEQFLEIYQNYGTKNRVVWCRGNAQDLFSGGPLSNIAHDADYCLYYV
jgi:hypothetical protein